ncbi:TolC family protein [Thermodesulforhabdus norvegica]|uniref:Outer membrane protein TolC n=1 Tax=Thermodesulforhabdus norvegica TaxID=39841 RepID=A0A1I4QY18_9BACT|nr:TolC family protein [Thermodesulforhabdus norvegica]SFM44938.1 Outer membrane protein TolC [Thermodesulforhabdus norvegica]
MRKYRAGNLYHPVVIPLICAFFFNICGCGYTGRPFKEEPGMVELLEEDAGIGEFLQNENYQLPSNPSFDDYFTYAAFRNRELRAIFERWKAALWKIPQVKSLPDPRFTYAYYIKNVETRVGPQRQSFSIAQTFPWYDKLRLKGETAFLEAEALRWELESKRWKLYEDLSRLYYDLAYTRRAVDITNDHIALLGHLESALKIGYSAGIVPYGYLTQLQTEMGKLENRLKTLEDYIAALEAEFNSLLHRSVWEPVVVGELRDVGSVSINERDALRLIEESSPDLKVAEKRVALAQKGVDLAKTFYFPDLTLSVTAIDTGDADNPLTPESGKDPVIVGVSVNLPFWWERIEAGVKEARTRYEASIADREKTLDLLSARLKLILYRLRDSERKIRLYGNDLIPKARQSLEVNLENLRTGEATFSDVINAERVLLEFELSLEEARAGAAKALAAYERLIGRRVDKASK